MQLLISYTRVSALVLLFSVLAACSGGGSNTPVSNEQSPATTTPDPEPTTVPTLALEFTEPPFDLQGNAAQYAADVSYGPDARNVFDIFLPESDAPTSLAIYIHGGGFDGGDKESAYSDGGDAIVRSLLERNIAFASINYRLLEDMDEDGVIKPMSDSQRALQFMRYHSASLNINKMSVGLLGGSAGAGTSLWLAFSDDRAIVDHEDPVLRESTRVQTAVAIETQGSYDLVRWETDIFQSFGITLDLLSADPELAARILSFNGADSLADLYTEQGAAYRADVDMLALMSVDDPEFFVSNANHPGTLPASTSALLHHPRHGQVLLERADAIGLSSVVYLPTLGILHPSGEGPVDFLIRKLNQ
ncbi:MAG: alpha/beta hydrolase fold domain-containing protein [Pseudomonadales bacterium]